MADTKNFGLKGVGNDIQLGKAGSRINLSGTSIQARNAVDGAYVIVKALDPVADVDLATKLYVDNVAAGLDPKESCTMATTADMGATYAAGGGAAGNGQFTAVPATLDGVTLATGDRVLVKNEADATQNGIYVVTGTTTIIDRATDHDSNAEVNAGNFTFIEEGTVNADSGWVLQGPDPLTINTSNLNWVLFSSSSDILAGDGITKTANTLNLDFVNGGGLTAATATAGADQIAFADATGGDAMFLRTWTNVLADLDIVTATANGMIVRTSADNYASRTITASAVAGDEGISIVNGDGVAGNPTIGIDIVGQTVLATVETGDEMLISDANAATANKSVTVDVLKTFMNAGTSSTSITEGDSSVAVADAGAGTVTTTIDGVVTILSNISGTTFTTDSATTNADIPVIRVSATSTGTPAAGIGPSIEFESETAAGGPGNQEVGGLLALAATDVTSTSEDFDFVFQLMAGGAAATEVARIASTGSITSSALTDNRVLIAGASGVIEDDANFTFNGTTLALTAAMDITGDLDVDNININLNTISSTAGTDLNITPLAGQQLILDGTIIIDAGVVDGITDLDAGNINIVTNTISNTSTDADLILLPNGTGSIILQNGSGEEILELNDTVSAVNGLAITAGATGNPAQITTGTGAEANIDIGFLTNGTGVLSVVAGSGNYEDNILADDDIPNKKYVDDTIGSRPGGVSSISGSVDLTTASVQAIGAADGIPANCTIMSVTLDVDVAASTAATTVTVGDVTNGAASYMAATENDPEIIDVYIADGYVLNGAGDRQANATVATPSVAGTATCIITYRLTGA